MIKFVYFFVGLFLTLNDLSAFDLTLKPSVFKNEKYEFSFLNFIDARLNKQKAVGYTRIGFSTKIEEILLPNNFAKYCDTVFSSSGIKYGEAAKIIPVITQITVQETHGGGDEFSHVSFSMDFYLAENDSCFLYYSTFVKIFVHSGFDICKKHGKSLSEAFAKAFLNLNDFMISKQIAYSSKKIKISLLI